MNKKTENTQIHILDSHTANCIAAGEVVERPASVVKELVENAIDAKATRIEVRIFDVEFSRIQVTDNGSGMGPSDMRLSVLRHATSKINNADDLNHLTTLGFRGEALPSIAAVSKLTITSKTSDAKMGYTMTVEAGKASVPTEAAARTGTTINVEKLFFNTPARKKFLKSTRTENSLISGIISELIVAHPEIAFTLRHGNHRAIVSSGNNDLAQAVQSAYGRETADNLLRINSEDGMVGGLISLPSFNRAGYDGYHFFVNGRPVRCRDLYLAIEDGYFTLMPIQRYPVVFLQLNVMPDDIDVNVHPSKLEIKFRDVQKIKTGITQAIRQALCKNERLVPQLKQKIFPRDCIDVLPPAPINKVTEPNVIPPKEDKTIIPKVAEVGQTAGIDLYRALYQGTNIYQSIKQPSVNTTLSDRELTMLTEKYTVDTEDEKTFCYSALTIIGQYIGSFIIAADDHDLYIIDQHAAAERVLYERIAQQALENTQPDVAMLAVPLDLTVSYADHLQLTEHILDLRDFGFILEYFGDTTYLIRGVPVWYGETQAEELLSALLEQLKEGAFDQIKLRKEQLFKAACKQAIKANHYLSRQDIQGLLSELDKCQNPMTCPHGRPIAIKLNESEIRKRFLRSSI